MWPSSRCWPEAAAGLGKSPREAVKLECRAHFAISLSGLLELALGCRGVAARQGDASPALVQLGKVDVDLEFVGQ